ncbi:MAG: hypothetical protein DBY24_04670 [Prevotellaceae bacterium]|nr:MAG: hypothetical protein DBY24_04670 [Prevotellaceae bacterium]
MSHISPLVCQGKNKIISLGFFTFLKFHILAIALEKRLHAMSHNSKGYVMPLIYKLFGMSKENFVWNGNRF